MIFYWLLVTLAVLDTENLWLPDWLTFAGMALGFLLTTLLAPLDDFWGVERATAKSAALDDLLAILLAAGLILVIRWLYRLVRRREGMGLGDAKLMAMLAAWLGFPGALLAFVLGAVMGALVGVILLVAPATKTDRDPWAAIKLPFGTFLCIGGIISSLWGQPMIDAYLHWAGF